MLELTSTNYAEVPNFINQLFISSVMALIRENFDHPDLCPKNLKKDIDKFQAKKKR